MARTSSHSTCCRSRVPWDASANHYTVAPAGDVSGRPARNRRRVLSSHSPAVLPDHARFALSDGATKEVARFLMTLRIGPLRELRRRGRVSKVDRAAPHDEPDHHARQGPRDR